MVGPGQTVYFTRAGFMSVWDDLLIKFACLSAESVFSLSSFAKQIDLSSAHVNLFSPHFYPA